MPEMTDAANAGTPIGNGSIDDRSGKDLFKVVLAKIAAKQAVIADYNRYYFGNHPFNFSSEKFQTEFARRLHKFRDNLCPTCVKAPADRLEVIGFSSDRNSDTYKTSWDVWRYSQMPRQAKRIHRDAFRTGDGFVVVWADVEGKARIYPQDNRNCTVFYDPETGEVDSGAKVYRGIDNYIYVTLYFRDRIEKYISKNPQSSGNMPTTAAAFEKRISPGDEGQWPLKNETGVCPLFHFGLETSILNDVIPLNDALNKTIADLLVSSEANSLRQRYAAGLTFEVNPETGKQIIPFEPAQQWIAAQDPAARFGQFPDIALQAFTETAEFFVDQISSVSGIPKYYFKLEGGSMPSGEALRKAEARLTAIVKDAQNDFGETWSRVVNMALKIDGTGPGGELETQWTPADPMSANEQADLGLKKKNLGVSEARILSEIGYTDDDIKQMQEANADAAKTKADNFAKTFAAGPQVG